jgi:hypothetical protein
MIWKINHVAETDQVVAGLRSLSRDCNQRLIVEYALHRSLGPDNNLAVDLFLRINAFSPLPFNAAVDAQWIYGTH